MQERKKERGEEEAEKTRKRILRGTCGNGVLRSGSPERVFIVSFTAFLVFCMGVYRGGLS